MVGIQNEQEKEDNKATSNGIIDRVRGDYINVKQMLHDIKHFDIIYHNKNHHVVYRTGNGHNDKPEDKEDAFSTEEKETATIKINSMIGKEFASLWTVNDLHKFNDEIVDILEKSRKYDCLIYVISCHSSKHYLSNGKNITMLYDSFENEYPCYEKMFDKFNNRKCSNLEKKAKIFFIYSHNTIVNNNKHNNNSDDAKIDYLDQYKRVIYANTGNHGDADNDNDNSGDDHDAKQDDKVDGGLLINPFSVSLCNNINDSSKDNENITDLNHIIQETELRIKKVNVLNQIYDENYIADGCQIVFTSFEPLQSTKYVEIEKDNTGMIKIVSQLQQSDLPLSKKHTVITTKYKKSIRGTLDLRMEFSSN